MEDIIGIMLPKNPIFIVGYPRSGTTLLQAILAAQEGMYTLPETHFFNVIYKAITLDEREFIEAACLAQCFQKIREKMNLQFSTTESERILEIARARELDARKLFEIIVAKYVNNATLGCESSFRWIEKTPNHAYFLGKIVSYYPNAQFVNIVRHPIAAIYSRKKFFPFNKDTPVETLAALWMRSIESVETFEKQHPGKTYTIQYEALVKNPGKELRKLGAFLNVTIDLEAIEEYHWENTFILPWETWKKNALSGKIINTNQQWKHKIRVAEILRIQHIVQEKMERLGYSAAYPCLQKIYNVWRSFPKSPGKIFRNPLVKQDG